MYWVYCAVLTVWLCGAVSASAMYRSLLCAADVLVCWVLVRSVLVGVLCTSVCWLARVLVCIFTGVLVCLCECAGLHLFSLSLASLASFASFSTRI